jgi:2-isopropylmalate synthase
MDDIGNWVEVFTQGITQELNSKQFSIFKQEVVEQLKATNYTQKEGWMADYVRLRVKAIKR